MFGGYPPTAIGYPPTAIGYTPTAINYTPTAIGYPPTAIGYPPTAIGYPPTAIGYTPTAIGYTPTAIGYPPTAISYPPAAIIGRIGHSEFFFLLWQPLVSMGAIQRGTSWATIPKTLNRARTVHAPCAHRATTPPKSIHPPPRGCDEEAEEGLLCPPTPAGRP